MSNPRQGQNKKRIQDVINGNEKFHAALEVMYAAYASVDDHVDQLINDAEALLSHELFEMGLAVRLLGKGNNTNYLVSNLTDAHDKIVIQVSKISPEAEAGYIKAASAGRQNWQAATHDKVSGMSADNNVMIHVTAMEYCPDSLSRFVEKNAAAANHANKIKAAIDVGGQLSHLLTSLTRSGVIWTDMKPGNILMRADGQIVIADTKGLIDPTKLPVRKGVISMGDLTKEYLSEDFQQHKQVNTKREDIFNVWNKEYSYQLGVTLHYIATGGPARHAYVFPWQQEQQKQLLNSAEPVFDFSHPVFKTAAGKRLQVVIESLGAKQSENRISHVDAVECLKLLNNPVEFNEKIKVASRDAKKNAGLVTSVSSDEAARRLEAIEKMKSAQAQLISAKIEERLAREKIQQEKSVRGKFKKAWDKVRDQTKVKVSKTVEPNEQQTQKDAHQEQEDKTPKLK